MTHRSVFSTPSAVVCFNSGTMEDLSLHTTNDGQSAATGSRSASLQKSTKASSSWTICKRLIVEEGSADSSGMDLSSGVRRPTKSTLLRGVWLLLPAEEVSFPCLVLGFLEGGDVRSTSVVLKRADDSGVRVGVVPNPEVEKSDQSALIGERGLATVV